MSNMVSGIPLDTAYTLSTFVEMFIHGIYTMLLANAFPLMLGGHNQRLTRRISMSWIFPLATILLYTVSTIHVILSLYRFMQAYIVPGHPTPGWQYFWSFSSWDSLMSDALVTLMTWIGDALVIYRCYYVWGNSLSFVILPLFLFAGTVAINIYTLVWFQRPYLASQKGQMMSLDSIYPLNLIQNIMTTGLIALKIWMQHRRSAASGVVDRGSRLSLLKVVRIMVESAMLYTVQLFILMILHFLHDNFQFVVQSAVVPSIGIVFVLITIRMDLAKRQDAGMGTSVGLPSAWLVDSSNSMMDISPQRRAASMDASGDLPPKTEETGRSCPTFEQ